MIQVVVSEQVTRSGRFGSNPTSGAIFFKALLAHSQRVTPRKTRASVLIFARRALPGNRRIFQPVLLEHPLEHGMAPCALFSSVSAFFANSHFLVRLPHKMLAIGMAGGHYGRAASSKMINLKLTESELSAVRACLARSALDLSLNQYQSYMLVGSGAGRERWEERDLRDLSRKLRTQGARKSLQLETGN